MFISIVSDYKIPILLWKKCFYLILLKIISITFVPMVCYFRPTSGGQKSLRKIAITP